MSEDQSSSCNDPHYMDMLESILRLEVEGLKKTAQGIQLQIKEKKELVHAQLQTRKEIREQSKNAQVNMMMYTGMLRTLDVYRSSNMDKINAMKRNEDDAYKIQKLEYEKYDRLINEYKETWESYQVKYEQLPLAKVREKCKMYLAKQQTEKMILQYKVAELAEMERKAKYISWLRMREKIIEFAKAMAENKKHHQKLEELKAAISLRDAELKSIDEELSTQRKRIQEEKEKRALDLLKMPPPKFNFSYNRPTSVYRDQAAFSGKWTEIYENSLDSMSIDSLMLEELPEQDDKANQSEEEMESDVENNAAEAEVMEEINTHDPTIEPGDKSEGGNEERERDRYVETQGHHGDKNVIIEADENDQEVEPRNKKFKLCVDNGQSTSAIPKIPTPVKNKTHGKLVPRIKKIESVNYDIQPIMKSNPDNISPPNAYYPCNYACSDNTSLSFSVNDDDEPFEADMPIREGSICNYSEYSNISPSLGDAEDGQSSIDFRGNVQHRSAQSFSQFDFSNLFGPALNAKNIF